MAASGGIGERYATQVGALWTGLARTLSQLERLAVTGSNVSPGLFESLELLGKDESLTRLAAAAGADG